MPALDVSKCTDGQKADLLKYASEARRFEIERFWQRSLFFWGFIGVAFVAYGVVSDNRHSDPVATLAVSAFGLIASLAWLLVNRGSKYWQEAWEAKVAAVELDVLGARLFSNIEPIKSQGLLGAGPYSVSRLTSILSLTSVLIWTALFLRQLNIYQVSQGSMICLTANGCWDLVILVVTGILVLALLVGGRARWSSGAG